MEEKIIEGAKDVLIACVAWIAMLYILGWSYWPIAQLFYWLDGV